MIRGSDFHFIAIWQLFKEKSKTPAYIEANIAAANSGKVRSQKNSYGKKGRNHPAFNSEDRRLIWISQSIGNCHKYFVNTAAVLLKSVVVLDYTGQRTESKTSHGHTLSTSAVKSLTTALQKYVKPNKAY